MQRHFNYLVKDTLRLSPLRKGRERKELHRALRRLSLSPIRLLIAFLLAASFNYLAWNIREPLGAAWRVFFEFWFSKLGIAGSVTMQPAGLFSLKLMLPHLEIATRGPGATTLWIALGVTLLVILLTLYIPENFLPLRYFLRLCCFIQGTALIFFAILPQEFPISLPIYAENLQKSVAYFLFLIPWVHAVIYYLSDHSLLQKGWLTFLTLVFVVVAAPSLVMTHIYILSNSSTLLLPLLYLLFSVWPLLVSCIALYGWAMSWTNGSNSP